MYYLRVRYGAQLYCLTSIYSHTGQGKAHQASANTTLSHLIFKISMLVFNQKQSVSLVKGGQRPLGGNHISKNAMKGKFNLTFFVSGGRT